MNKIALLTLLSALAFGNLHAQAVYKIDKASPIGMKLSGTSTFHDWDMNAKSFTGDAKFGFKPENAKQLVSISALSFCLHVLDLKSDETALDNNAYKALKTGTYRDIVYTLSSSAVVQQPAGNYLVKTQGWLTIAGVTKGIAMDVLCTVNPDAGITCKGSKSLKMTDYNVKPPSFMAGVMKTGDDITLDFNMVYKK
ncbi:MAG: YceI family protein [Bacteroidota bacterium]